MAAKKQLATEQQKPQEPQQIPEISSPHLDDGQEDFENLHFKEPGGESERLDMPRTSEEIEQEEIEKEQKERVDAEELIETMSMDAFFGMFTVAMSAPGTFFPKFAPVGVQENERRNAREASDSLYRLLLKNAPWMLSPKSETFKDIVTAGMFLGAKVSIVAMILKAERSEKARDVTPPKETNDDGGEYGRNF